MDGKITVHSETPLNKTLHFPSCPGTIIMGLKSRHGLTGGNAGSRALGHSKSCVGLQYPREQFMGRSINGKRRETEIEHYVDEFITAHLQMKCKQKQDAIETKSYTVRAGWAGMEVPEMRAVLNQHERSYVEHKVSWFLIIYPSFSPSVQVHLAVLSFPTLTHRCVFRGTPLLSPFCMYITVGGKVVNMKCMQIERQPPDESSNHKIH